MGRALTSPLQNQEFVELVLSHMASLSLSGHFMEVAVPMVIFTNAELELGEMRSKFGHGRLTKFVPREIDDFHTQRVFGETWKKDFARDREARLHKSPPVWKSTGLSDAR